MGEALTERIQARIEDRRYDWRAYLSSGLTALTNQVRQELTADLERLFLEVFDPLGVFLYLPHMWSSPGHESSMAPEHVHILDRLRIAESDFVVLCADHPSFGAGQEFEIGQAMGLPILLYAHESAKVSRMLLGGAAVDVLAGRGTRPSEGVIRYKDFHNLCDLLRDRVVELIHGKLKVMQATPGASEIAFGEKLRAAMQSRNLGAKKLAAASGLSEAFVDFLTSRSGSLDQILDKHDLPRFKGAMLRMDKYVNPGLHLLHRLAVALDVEIEELFEVRVESNVAQARATRDEIRGELKRWLEDQGRGERFKEARDKLDAWTEPEWNAARSSNKDTLKRRFEQLFRF